MKALLALLALSISACTNSGGGGPAVSNIPAASTPTTDNGSTPPTSNCIPQDMFSYPEIIASHGILYNQFTAHKFKCNFPSMPNSNGYHYIQCDYTTDQGHQMDWAGLQFIQFYLEDAAQLKLTWEGQTLSDLAPDKFDAYLINPSLNVVHGILEFTTASSMPDHMCDK